MNIRQETEEREKLLFSPYAFFSKDSRGRMRPMEEDDLRTCFQRDRDRVIHSKAFRRLKQKTQVFSSYEYNDHLRTRLTHTMEVSQVARTIARALRLNEDLTEAISLAHDIGHCAFSHCGETVLNELFGGFTHTQHSAELAQDLNLTEEVIDGILKHSTTNTTEEARTLEGRIVRYADKIAYLSADFDDGCRMGLISEADIPKEISSVLGSEAKKRMDTLIRDMIKTSMNQPYIRMSEPVAQAFGALRRFMFERLYKNEKVREKDAAVRRIFYTIYETERKKGKPDAEILEFMAGMTDSYAVQYCLDLYNVTPGFMTFR